MQKLRNYTALIVLWLLFSNATVLLLFRLLISYGKVELTLDYTAFKKEKISVYWSELQQWDTEKYAQKNTITGRKKYNFTIRHADTIRFLRFYPDKTFDSAIVHSITVKGLHQPLSISKFTGVRTRGLTLSHKDDGDHICKDSTGVEPQMIINIPENQRDVISNWKFSDTVFLLLLLIADIAVLIICIRCRLYLRVKVKPGFFIVIAFLLIISVHWSNYLFDYYPVQPNIEKRELQKFPGIDSLLIKPDSVFMKYSQACFDHFSFRNVMIKSRSVLYLDLFGQSSMPQKVLVGDNNMFFISFPWFMKDFTGKINYWPEYLDSLVYITKEKHDMLARQGIKFMVIVPPSKQTIYYDLMPEYYRQQYKKPVILDQISAAMKKAGVDYFINLSETMLGAKNSNPDRLLYYPNDTHWNEYGAFKAYQPVMKLLCTLDTGFSQPLDESVILIDNATDMNADLAECLIISDINKRNIFRIHPFCDDKIPMTMVPEPIRTSDSYICANRNGHGKVLFYRDSYFVAWQQFFTHHINQSTYIWDYKMDMNEIMRFKPDIVILEIGEMCITKLGIPIKPLKGHAN